MKVPEYILQIRLEKLGGPEMEMWSFPVEMDRWGAGGVLVKMDGAPSGGNSTLIYFVQDAGASALLNVNP